MRFQKFLLMYVAPSIFLFPSVSFSSDAPSRIRNVIMMIPDGMSISQTTLARWLSPSKKLRLDEIVTGLVQTYGADSIVTDSAPSATAMATGRITKAGYLSVLPDSVLAPNEPTLDARDAKKPLLTVLEAAKMQGRSAGLVVTCQFPHATPAAFSAHLADRKAFDDIAEQQVEQDLDVVFGGGTNYLDPKIRADGEDLFARLKSGGIDVIATRAELLRRKPSISSKVWGLFAAVDLPYDLDRDPEKIPSLAEMTHASIEQLDLNQKGFFLMVEGSKIDWAAHNNDAVAIATEVLAFDKAVGVALDYARGRTDTVVVVAADHGNSGLSLGNLESSTTYDKMSFTSFTGIIKGARRTIEGIGFPEPSKGKEALAQYGILDSSREELRRIKKALALRKRNAEDLSFIHEMSSMMAKRNNLGFTTYGHTGEEVVLYGYHPHGKPLSGLVRNADIGRYLASMFQIDFAKEDRGRYVEANAVFAPVGAVVGWQGQLQKDYAGIVIKGAKKMILPANKKLAIIDGHEFALPRFNVVGPDYLWIAPEAVSIFNQP